MRSIGLSLSLVVTIAVASPAFADAPFVETMRTIQSFGNQGFGNRDSVWSSPAPSFDGPLVPGIGLPVNPPQSGGGGFDGIFGSFPALGGSSDDWPPPPAGGGGGNDGGGASGHRGGGGTDWHPEQDSPGPRGSQLPAPGAALLGMLGFGFIGRLRRRTAG